MAQEEAPPPAYQVTGGAEAYPNLGASEGGADAAPPAYNPNASNVALSNEQKAAEATPLQIAQQPEAVQAPVQIVQQPNVMYVQNGAGEPTSIPIQATPNIMYVNQYGQAIAPPVQQVQVAAAPNVMYVNQYGQPIAAPQPQRFVASTRKARPEISEKDQKKRNIATGMAFLCGLLIFISWIVGSMARSGDNECTMHRYTSCSSCSYDYDDIEYSRACDDYYDSYYYYEDDTAQLCDIYGISVSNGDCNDAWCSTYSSANWFIALTVFGWFFILPSILIAQPWCYIERCCCPTVLPKIFFIISGILNLAAIIAWYGGQSICHKYLAMAPGATPIMIIISTILMFTAGFIAV